MRARDRFCCVCLSCFVFENKSIAASIIDHHYGKMTRPYFIICISTGAQREVARHWESVLCTRAIIKYTHDRATPSIYGRVIRVFADGNSVSRGDPSLFVSRRRPKADMPPPQSVFAACREFIIWCLRLSANTRRCFFSVKLNWPHLLCVYMYESA